jgi:hypothetical protein
MSNDQDRYLLLTSGAEPAGVASDTSVDHAWADSELPPDLWLAPPCIGAGRHRTFYQRL